MRIIELDASVCRTPLELLDAFGRAIGLPDGRDADIDTIVKAMLSGSMNSAQSPTTIRVMGAAKVSSDVKREIEALAKALGDARLWRRNHRCGEIVTAIEIAS